MAGDDAREPRRGTLMARYKIKPPRITVITPSIPSRSAMLAESVQSVAAQTLKPAAHLIGVDHHYDGPAKTINRLVRASDTEWLSILADDDLYDRKYLATLARYTANADVVLAWFRMEGRDDPPFRGDWDPHRLRNRQATGFAGTFLFRRALFDKIGGWPDGLAEDWTFMVNALDAGARFVPVYQELWTYRMHDGSTSTIIGELDQGIVRPDIYHLRKYLR